MWVEKEGAYGNAERRTQFWHQLVKAPGEALRPVAVDGVLQALQGRGRLAGGADRQEARVRGQDAVRRAVRNGKVDKFPLKETAPTTTTTSPRPSASTCRRACSRNTPFGRGHGHDLAPFDAYHKARGLRWPVVNGKETRWRYREGSTPT
jgi:nitrate reductase NapA